MPYARVTFANTGPVKRAAGLADNPMVRRVFDRWRLTLIGCPLLAVVSYVATGRLAYTLLVLVLSAVALALCDTFVNRHVEQPDKDG
jgi:hypothetical protein